MKKLVALMMVVTMLTGVFAFANAETEPVEIEFFQATYSHAEVVEKIVNDFNALNNGVRVNLICLPDDTSYTVLANRIQNRDVPDIFDYEISQELYDMVDMGLLANLADKPYAKYIKPSALEQCEYNGGVYLLPITVSFMGVFYNKDMFAEHGWTVPTTEDEFWALCEQIQAAGITPIAAGDKTGSNIAHWVQDLIGVYCPNYVEDFRKVLNGEMTIAEMEGMDEVANIVVQRTKFAQEDPLGYGTDEQITLFANQEAAMYPNGSWRMARLNAKEPAFEYGVFPFPAKTADKTAFMSDIGFPLCVSAALSEEKAAAVDVFMDYMYSEGAKYFIETNNLPSAIIGINPDTTAYESLLAYFDDGRVFSMPSTCRWDAAYADYTSALQELVMTGAIEVFYENFTNALVDAGMPTFYRP